MNGVAGGKGCFSKVTWSRVLYVALLTDLQPYQLKQHSGLCTRRNMGVLRGRQTAVDMKGVLLLVHCSFAKLLISERAVTEKNPQVCESRR